MLKIQLLVSSRSWSARVSILNLWMAGAAVRSEIWRFCWGHRKWTCVHIWLEQVVNSTVSHFGLYNVHFILHKLVCLLLSASNKLRRVGHICHTLLLCH